MQISVIIPTCNRVQDLKKTLDSLLKQTIFPDEVIIVDDSDDRETKNMLKKDKQSEIQYKYIRKAGEKSGAISRNIGIKNAMGDIIFFFDDDVILENNYIEKILEIYAEKQNTVGVQGYILNRRKSEIKNIVNKFFFLVHSEYNKNRLLPSLEVQ